MGPTNIVRQMRALSALLRAAEDEALRGGDDRIGPEHLLLAALELPDGTAGRALARAGADPGGLRGALAQEHADALASVGITAPPEPADVPDPSSGRGRYRRTPAADRVIGEMARRGDSERPRRLVGAHVVAAVAELEHGTAARALVLLGVERAALLDAAEAELVAWRAGAGRA